MMNLLESIKVPMLRTQLPEQKYWTREPMNHTLEVHWVPLPVYVRCCLEGYDCFYNAYLGWQLHLADKIPNKYFWRDLEKNY